MNKKSALRVIVMEGMTLVPKLLHISFTDGNTIMSPFSPYASLLMPTMWHSRW